MSVSPGDLAPLMVQPPAQAVRYGQGIILDWNTDTFENVIQWRDLHLINLPVLSGTDALTYQFGDTVGLLGWDSGGKKGGASWWILGRLVIPGAGAAENVISWMTSSLAQRLAAGIASARWNFDIVEATEEATSVVYGDLATIGPQLTVEVVTDKILVTIGDWMQFAGGSGGGMSIEVQDSTGGVVVAAGEHTLQVISGGAADPTQWAESSKQIPLEGLAPGVYTITAKYAAIGPAASCFHTDRIMSAEGL